MDILEKAISLTTNIEIPLPRPRLVTEKEIIPTDNTSLIKMEDDEVKKEDGETVKKVGVTMKVPDVLEVNIDVSAQEAVLNVGFAHLMHHIALPCCL